MGVTVDAKQNFNEHANIRGVARIFEWGDETPKASGRDAEGAEGVCLEGVSPSQWGLGLGRGLCPLPKKFLEFHPPKGDILRHFYTFG